VTVPKRPSLSNAGLLTHTEEARIGVPAFTLYDWFVPVPLEAVLPGGGGLAGVERTDNLAGPAWGLDGARRRVVLKDGSSAFEAIVQAARPRLFRYQVWGFTGLPGLLLDHAQGRFVFDEAGEGATKLSWSYAFCPRAKITAPLVRRFVRTQFSGFMREGLLAMKAKAEADLL
jgi:hypothetical protein